MRGARKITEQERHHSSLGSGCDESRHRRRSALVNVRYPQMEGDYAEFESDAGDAEGDRCAKQIACTGCHLRRDLFADRTIGNQRSLMNMQNLLLQVLGAEGKTVMLITHSVDEAIYLSSRIVVVTARPARIKRIIDIDFPYPRQEAIQERAEFGEIRKIVRELVMSEYQAQQAQGVVRFSE